MTALAMGAAGFEEYPTFAKKVGVPRALWNNLKRMIPNFKLFMDLKYGSGSTTYPDDTSIIGRLRRESGILPIKIAREGGGYGPGKKKAGLGEGNYDFSGSGTDLGKGQYDFSK